MALHVTIQNMGINDVGGVTLVVRMLGNDNELGRFTKQFETLVAGEQIKIRGGIITELKKEGNPDWPWSTYVATLMLGDTVLDERKLTQ